MQPPTSWDRSSLKAVGLSGFTPLVGIDLSLIPNDQGIYVVLRADATRDPILLADNPVTRSTVRYTVDELAQRWVLDAAVVYIGKAAGAGGLQARLRPFSKKSKSHSGGRSIWQLEEADSLIVAWATTRGEVAGDVETAWIKAFQQAHGGRRPFANRRN